MKRSRKTLFALLLALVMTLGLAATAWATPEVVPTDTLELTITKKVVQTGNVAPPAETFTFELEDAADEKRPLADYGITLMADGLTISTTAGTGTFNETFRFTLPTSDFVKDHWDRVANEENEYRKTFLLKEKDGDKAGWVYSDTSYYAVFTYNISEQKKGLEVYVSGDATSPAEFTNTYTGTTVEIPFTKTVKLGGNRVPGKTDFTLEIFKVGNGNKEEYKDVTYTAVVTTNGADDYDGKLIISGPEEQVRQYINKGIYVREVNGGARGWTYSTAEWYVDFSSREDQDGKPLPTIHPYDVQGDPVEKMTFVNIYTRNTSYTTPDEKPISSPKTFDAGVALYGVSALLSLTGAALVIKRKNG